MYYDRFDIVEAHYSFAIDYHSGQWSDLYARQCRISKYFTPAMAFMGYDSLTENGQMIYDNLVHKHENER